MQRASQAQRHLGSPSSPYGWVLLSAVLVFVLPHLAWADDPFRQGEVFAAVGNGRVMRFSASGNSLGSLPSSSQGQMTGMCFDLEGNLYTTNFSDGSMTKLDSAGVVVARRWGGPFSSNPESCVVDKQGNVYTGEVHGENRLRKFDPNGNLLTVFSPRAERTGLDWIDLAADQCTMLYTSEGPSVLRFDVCRNHQESDFATGLGGTCFALRVRENGEVMVTCERRIYRLSTQGRVLESYPIEGETLFGMNLDPDGEHLWTGGVSSGNVYKVHIGSGRGTTQPIFQATGSVLDGTNRWLGLLRQLVDGDKLMGGLAVYGERPAALAAELRRREQEEGPAAERRRQEKQSFEQERRRQADEQAKLETAKRKLEEQRLEAERRRLEEQAKLETARRKLEEEQRLEAERRRLEEQARLETAKRKLEEEQRLEAERRRLEEQARLETAKRKLEEEQRLEAERRRQGKVSFGPAVAVDLGRVAPEAPANGAIDLAGTRLEGEAQVLITTDLETRGVILEIKTERGWQELGRRPIEIPIEEAGDRTWALRARVKGCNQGIAAGTQHHVRIEAPGFDSSTAVLEVPLAISVDARSKLRCWWPIIAGTLGLLLLGTIFHGFVSSAHFAPRIGVLLSQEEDMSEGFFHSIRGCRGSSSGFYRDARIYIGRDYRLTQRAAGALACLRADGEQVSIQPLHGAYLERRAADGEWEPVPAEQSRIRIGVTYRDDTKSLFFELASR